MRDDERMSSARPRLSRPRSWSLATQLFAFQAAVILVVLLGAGVAAFSNAAAANADSAEDEVLGIARTLAAAPVVTWALSAPDPTAVLQPLAEQVRRDTGTDFVVVMTPDGIRYSHPDVTQIGGSSVARSRPRRPVGPWSRPSPAPLDPRSARSSRWSSRAGSPGSSPSAGRSTTSVRR